MSISKAIAEKFQKIVVSLQGMINILITQVDPDSLASAFMMVELIHRIRGGDNGVKVFYGGAIGHEQNRAICNRLGLSDRMHHASKMKDPDFHNLILLDSSKVEDGRGLSGCKLDPTIVIDHHRGSDFQDCECKFILIEDIGATSTLMFELFEGMGYKFDGVNSVALLLAVGIHTDTSNLVSCTERDISAYGKLMPNVDRQELIAVFNYPLLQTDYTCMLAALTNVSQRGASLVTNVGAVTSKEGDMLSTLADYLIRKDGVSVVIVWGLMLDTKHVRISARSTDISLDLAAFLREAFGPASGGKFMPDGKSIGGGVISIDFPYWLTQETITEALALVKKRIESAVFRP